MISHRTGTKQPLAEPIMTKINGAMNCSCILILSVVFIESVHHNETKLICYRSAEFLQFADDMVIDIPKIWAYLGEVMGAMIQEGDAVPMSFLKPACAPLQTFGRAGNVAAEVLKDGIARLVSEVTGHQTWFFA